MIILLQLFWSFVKIGFTSFGGLSMVPLISSEMTSHGWMTVEEVSDIVAIAEMTPGPLGINCATFAGIRTAGILGAVAANAGVLMPTMTFTLIAAIFIQKFKDSKILKNIMSGVRPVCIGMIFGIAISLCGTNYTQDGMVYIPYILLGILDVFLLFKKKYTVPKIIGINAAVGGIIFGLLGRYGM